MSFLTLVRHGQSAVSEGLALTDTGEAQARALGEWWLEHGVQFDEVQSGTLPRQRRTEEIVAGTFRGAGRAWPAVQISSDFDEYDSTGALDCLLPALAARDNGIRLLREAFEAERTNRNFQRMFEAVMNEWLAGAEAGGVESWPAFRARVGGALARIQDGAKNRRIAVFTSGGPIGLAVASVLGAQERAFLDLNWRVRNCSITEFLFGAGRISLDSFNATPHLAPRLVTFR